MKRLCVFCGSSPGQSPAYSQAARSLAKEMARRKIGLVFGGGRVGLMGVLADAALAEGNDVIGVIPRNLFQKEVGHAGIRDLRVVDSMHQRKQLMAELADGFLALPGGLGTLEELFEMLTWTQLDLQRKPCGLFNVNGYFDHLLKFLDQALAQGFIHEPHRRLLLVGSEAAALLDTMLSWQPPRFDKAEWALALNRRG